MNFEAFNKKVAAGVYRLDAMPDSVPFIHAFSDLWFKKMLPGNRFLTGIIKRKKKTLQN